MSKREEERRRSVFTRRLLVLGGVQAAALGLLGDAGLELAGVSVALELAALGGRVRLAGRAIHAISVLE